MLTTIKTFIGKLFRKQEKAVKQEAVKPKTIARIEELKAELDKLTQGYNRSINEIQARYNQANWKYSEAYEKLQEQVRGLTTESEIEALRDSVTTLEWELRDIGHEIDTVQGYKREDTLQILDEIQSLKESYLEEVRASITKKAERVQELKKGYLKAVGEVGAEATGLIHTEKVMEYYYQEHGIQYKATLSDELVIRTVSAPIKSHQLEVSTSEVRNMLACG